ncbi:MAG: hypothetical protein SFY32_04365 [Bacteroidota bacterium]|nr:hypothetical protein [Bacteroidota bacterium]
MSNPIWFISAILAGFLYAFLLYSGKHSWSTRVNLLVAFLRFFLVSGIVFLLISPYFKQRTVVEEKPIIIVGIDDSKSMKSAANTIEINALDKFISNIKSEGKVRVETFLLSGKQPQGQINTISFDYKRTDINAFLTSIENMFDGSNLSDVVIFSDGINNAGVSPTFKSRNYNIHTIGVGDTTDKKDIFLKNVLYNKLSSSKAKFPLLVEFSNYGFSGQKVNLLLKEKQKVLISKEIMLSNSGVLDKVELYWQETENGLHHYQIEIQPVAGEFNPKNNTVHAYIEITDLKSTILLAALAPHPDIKAIKSALEKDNNIVTEYYIGGQTTYKPANYDLAIIHQIPNSQAVGSEVLNDISKKSTSFLFIVGNQSDVKQINAFLGDFTILAQPNQFDKVTPTMVSSFNRFTLEPDVINYVSKYPPLSVPFGAYNTGTWEKILLQKVGSLTTDKPLFAIKLSAEKNFGIITGEGLWQWRMSEFADKGNSEYFDQFVKKSVQLLVKKDAKSKFRLSPVQPIFGEDEMVSFNIEAYNDLFEIVTGNAIKLKLFSEGGQTFEYNIVNTSENNPFIIKGLQKGVYKYQAITNISGKDEKVKGEFIIKSVDLEDETSKADFNLLRELSTKNNGLFATINSIDNLTNSLLSKSTEPIVTNTENLLELISLKWLCFFFLALIFTEWFVRKWLGSY